MKYFITFDDGPHGDRFAILKEFDNYHVALTSAYWDEYELPYDKLTVCDDFGDFGSLSPHIPDFRSFKPLRGFEDLVFEYCGQSDPWIWWHDVENNQWIGGNAYDVEADYLEDDPDAPEKTDQYYYDSCVGWLCSFGIPVKDAQ